MITQIVKRVSRLLALQRLVASQLRGPAQRVAVEGLERLGQRWPMLAELLSGLLPSSPAPKAAGPGADTVADAEIVTSAPDAPAGVLDEGTSSVDVATSSVDVATSSVDVATSSVDVATCLRDLEVGGDWAVRAAAVRDLAAAAAAGHVAPSDIMPSLREALRDASVEVANAAVEALGKLDGDLARAALRAVLDNAERFYHPVVRAAAVRIVAQLRDATDDELLYRALRDQDAEVSVSAIAAVAARDDRRSAEYLLGILQDDSQYFLPMTRLTAARALGRVSELDAAQLSSLIEREGDPGVRAALSDAVRRAG